MDKIVKGDTTELKALVSILSTNQARLLIGVKDGKYQSVYLKCFGRVKPQRDDLIIKSLNDDYGREMAEYWWNLSPYNKERFKK
jgi:hypothetical protein